MPKLLPISHRELARKLRRAGYEVIRTSRHPVYYSRENDLTIPIPSHPGDVPKGTLRTIIPEMGLSRLKNSITSETGSLPHNRMFWHEKVRELLARHRHRSAVKYFASSAASQA